MAAALVWLGLTALGAPAHAAPGSVAVVPAPKVAAELRAPLSQAVAQAVSAAHLTPLGNDTLEAVLQGEAALRACTTASCLERLGTLLNASSVVVYSAIPDGPPSGRTTYQLQVDSYSVELGAQAASMASTCASCGAADVQKALRELARQVIAADLARPRGTLALDSEPPGALVLVDGNEAGRTPYQRQAFVGSHALVLRAPGFRSQKATISVAESHTSRIEVRLISGKEGQSISDSGAQPVYKKWWFWVIIGGAAAAAAGVTAGVVVSQMNGAASPPQSINHIVF